MERGFEIGPKEEAFLHDNLFVNLRKSQKQQFRPGINNHLKTNQQAMDVITVE